MLLFQLPGSFLLRHESRRFLALLFQEPLRMTRFAGRTPFRSTGLAG